MNEFRTWKNRDLLRDEKTDEVYVPIWSRRRRGRGAEDEAM